MRRFLAYAAILILAASCGLGEALTDYGDPVDLKSADVVGTWRSGKQRSIVFKEDGTFKASNLPHEAFDGFVPQGFDPVAQQLNGSGTWALAPPSGKPDGPKSTVALSFHRLADAEVASIGPDLSALRQDDIVYLVYFYVGGGGNGRCAYRK